MFKIGINLHSLRPEILHMTETIRITRFNARPVIVPMNLPLKTSTGTVAKAPLVLIDCETDQGAVGHALSVLDHAFGLEAADDDGRGNV
ncbi:hypothetical protein ACVWXQ_007269 [Bradyrhizobium sp. S3.14.4]